jgi:hypothetical protein
MAEFGAEPGSNLTYSFGSYGIGPFGATGQARASLTDGNIEYRVQVTAFGISIRYTTNSIIDDQRLDLGVGFVAGAKAGVNGFVGMGTNFGEAVPGGGNVNATGSLSGDIGGPVGLTGSVRVIFDPPDGPMFNSRYPYVHAAGNELPAYHIQAGKNPFYYPQDDPDGPFAPQIGGTSPGHIATKVQTLQQPGGQSFLASGRDQKDNPYNPNSGAPQVGGVDRGEVAKTVLTKTINNPGHKPSLGPDPFKSPNPADDMRGNGHDGSGSAGKIPAHLTGTKASSGGNSHDTGTNNGSGGNGTQARDSGDRGMPGGNGRNGHGTQDPTDQGRPSSPTRRAEPDRDDRPPTRRAPMC